MVCHILDKKNEGFFTESSNLLLKMMFLNKRNGQIDFNDFFQDHNIRDEDRQYFGNILELVRNGEIRGPRSFDDRVLPVPRCDLLRDLCQRLSKAISGLVQRQG